MIRFSIICILVLLLTGCIHPESSETKVVDDEKEITFIIERINDYSESYLPKLISMDYENLNNEEKLSVSFDFEPEVGSRPFKSRIYYSIASHATAIKMFFPEVKSFSYRIHWRGKEDAAKLELNEQKTYELLSNVSLLNDKAIDKQEALEIFSSISESNEIEKWDY